MDKPDLNPLYIIILYILRCAVPLALMLGLSYVLRKLGLIKAAPPTPKNWNGNNNPQRRRRRRPGAWQSISSGSTDSSGWQLHL